MTKAAFKNLLETKIDNITPQDIDLLWESYVTIYAELNLIESSRTLYIMDILIFSYPYLHTLSKNEHMGLLYTLCSLHTDIYFRSPYDYSDEKIEDTKRQINESIESGLVPTSSNKVIKQVCKKYVNQEIDKCIKSYYDEDNIEDFYFEATNNMMDYSLSYDDQETLENECMEIYERLTSIYPEIPNHLIKNSVLDSYDYFEFNEIPYQYRFNFILGLCKQTFINNIFDVNDCLIKHFKDSKINAAYKDEYFCYGILCCLDLLKTPRFTSLKEDFKRGQEYFTDDDGENKLYTLAVNINDYWHDAFKKEHTSEFQLGLLSKGHMVYLQDELQQVSILNVNSEEEEELFKEKIKLLN